MKRIFIIGTSGCGKTTLAKRLAAELNLDHIDTDDCYWLPGWRPRAPKEYRKIINQFITVDNWIISGNSSNLDSIIWQRCDTVIWLDYSIFRCFYQAICRSIRRIKNSEVCCGGNYESVGRFFSKDSIIIWIITSFWKRKRIYSKIFSMTPSPGTLYLKFKNPRAVVL